MNDQMLDPDSDDGSEDTGPVQQPRLWQGNGWTARVIKNDDDEGWAVAMYKDGEPEPALVGPWTMGRDKKNPKPFDATAFATFVKTASEVLDRSARQRDQALTKKLSIAWEGRWYEVRLEIVADEYEPHALLSAIDDAGATVAKHRVPANFKFNRDVANAWVREEFPEP